MAQNTTNNNYDSAFCGSLPLHLINLIQPYGMLLVLNKMDLTILQVSENVENITGVLPTDLVSKSMAEFISADQFQFLKDKTAVGISGKLPVRLTFTANGTPYNFISLIHEKDSYILVELELAGQHGKEELFADVYQEVKYAMSRINVAETTTDACNIAITELKRLSGFDKIMLYKFDKNWNGEVIAEVMEEGMDSYLGLHFPASDIPKQARAMYFKNPYRLIPSSDYTPVKIYPVINPLSGGFIDLSNCNLRSVPSVHIEYLKNMGVKASMSTAIIKDEQLWGLISCHHREEKYLNYEMCSVFELMAGIISSRIAVIENKEQGSKTTRLQQIQSKLMEQVYLDDNPVSGLLNYDTNILQLLDCEGVVVSYNRETQFQGNVPDRYEVKDIILWLQSQQQDRVYAINNLPAVYENAVTFAEKGSGIIVLPIHAEKGEYIIGFRPEVVQDVDWGGNPNEAINFEKNKVTYHPRNSFKLWRQKVEQTSLPWEKDQLAIAEGFRNFLIEYTLKKVYSLM